ncbi:unnamed protein product [Cylicocyclus nassatus]|uniref:Uncharacterized protein n=1 Tax=Cylicocyclus nassatus TaxID=53992 RepID=A0AA36HFS3_CYLNA|nr:unnamed protein product [Cylicocyclus nassatus]
MTAFYTSLGILVLYSQLIAGLEQLFDKKGLPSIQRINGAGSPIFVAPAPISTPIIAAVASMLPYKLPNNDEESASDAPRPSTKGQKSSTKSFMKDQSEPCDCSSR